MDHLSCALPLCYYCYPTLSDFLAKASITLQKHILSQEGRTIFCQKLRGFCQLPPGLAPFKELSTVGLLENRLNRCETKKIFLPLSQFFMSRCWTMAQLLLCFNKGTGRRAATFERIRKSRFGQKVTRDTCLKMGPLWVFFGLKGVGGGCIAQR